MCFTSWNTFYITQFCEVYWLANFQFVFAYNRSLCSLFFRRQVWDWGIVFQIQQMRFEIDSYFCNFADQSAVRLKAFSIDQFTVFCSNVLKPANTQKRFPHNAFIFFDCVEWNMRTHTHGFPIMRLFYSNVLSEICEHTDTVSPQCVQFIGSWQRTVGRTKCSLQYEAGWTECVWFDSSTS